MPYAHSRCFFFFRIRFLYVKTFGSMGHMIGQGVGTVCFFLTWRAVFFIPSFLCTPTWTRKIDPCKGDSFETIIVRIQIKFRGCMSFRWYGVMCVTPFRHLRNGGSGLNLAELVCIFKAYEKVSQKKYLYLRYPIHSYSMTRVPNKRLDEIP